jgi:hypothetical protein
MTRETLQEIKRPKMFSNGGARIECARMPADTYYDMALGYQQ